jgi:hypothetical protein
MRAYRHLVVRRRTLRLVVNQIRIGSMRRGDVGAGVTEPYVSDQAQEPDPCEKLSRPASSSRAYHALAIQCMPGHFAAA